MSLDNKDNLQQNKELNNKKKNSSNNNFCKNILCAVGIVLLLCLVFLVGYGIARYKDMGGFKFSSSSLNENQSDKVTLNMDNVDFSIDSDFKNLYNESLETQNSTTIHLGSTGCMLFHEDILNSYKANNGYNFDSIFKYIKKTYSSFDCMTCEFEGTVSDDSNGYTGYPEFRYPVSAITSIKKSGVDLQMCATNHINDAGTTGLNLTLQAFDNNKINYTGIKNSDGDKNYTIAVINNIVIGFVDYTYASADALNKHTMDSEAKSKINYFNLEDLSTFYSNIQSDINNMKKDGAQFIVTNIHWGDEYKLSANNSQLAIAKNLSNMGVDAIIGGHPHCVEPIDVLNSSDGKHKTFVIYSTGNALSNQTVQEVSTLMNTGHTEDGVIVDLEITKSGDDVAITGVDIIPTWVYKSSDKGNETYDYYILPLNNIDKLESKTGLSNIKDKAQASYNRTMSVLSKGLEKAKKTYDK